MRKSFSSDRKVLEDAFHELKKYTHLKVSFGSKAVTRSVRFWPKAAVHERLPSAKSSPDGGL